jgi:cytochrome P450
MAEQILSVTVDSQTHVTPEMLPKLPLLRQVIDETLRMFPVVWIADRKPQRALSLGPYTIPEGRRVIFSMLVTQRDARFFPEPERFDPGRFSPERVGQIPEGAYLPFGAGVHMCIGNHFALMELQIILAALLQKYVFGTVPGFKLRLNPQVVLSPVGALPLFVNARGHKPFHEKRDRVASRPNV